MKMLIDGQWVEAADGQWMAIYNPGTGEVIDKVPQATLQDAERAVAAAQQGKVAMRKLTAHERYTILVRVAECMEERVSELGRLLAQENGKPVGQTRAEVAIAGAQTLGTLVFLGWGSVAADLVLLGAIPMVLLSIIADQGVRTLERAIVSPMCGPSTFTITCTASLVRMPRRKVCAPAAGVKRRRRPLR